MVHICYIQEIKSFFFFLHGIITLVCIREKYGSKGRGNESYLHIRTSMNICSLHLNQPLVVIRLPSLKCPLKKTPPDVPAVDDDSSAAEEEQSQCL